MIKGEDGYYECCGHKLLKVDFSSNKTEISDIKADVTNIYFEIDEDIEENTVIVSTKIDFKCPYCGEESMYIARSPKYDYISPK